MRYEGLDPNTRYLVRLTGYRESRLRIDDQRVKPTLDGQGYGEFKEYPVPQDLLKDGKLLLTWESLDESPNNWREHSRVTEVWLLKQ